MSTAIVQYQPDAMAPGNLGEMMTLARDLAQSGLFPHLPNLGAVAAVMLKGHELGLSAMASLTEINVIKGKISVSATAMVGVCLGKRDVCEYFTLVEATPERATWKTKRKGSDEVRHTFTMEDAARMKLSGNDNYTKQPATMLRHRAASALARMVYPDLLVGCYAPEELADVPAEHVTARVEATEPSKTGPAALGLGPVQVPPVRTPKATPIEAARASLAKADTADKLDNLEIKIQASTTLTAEEKGALTTEISEARGRLAAPAGEV